MVDDDSDYLDTNRNDLIDSVMINIAAGDITVGMETEPLTFNGTHGLVWVVLSFEIVCAPNFTGRFCKSIIDNHCFTNVDICGLNGNCISGLDSFTCVCDPGFTGVYCETNVDDCAGVTCNDSGSCVDGVDSFTCVCDPGFTGEHCETNIDNCMWRAL